MPNGFMCPGGGANKIIIRARGVPDVLVQATLDGKTYSGTVGALGFVDIPVKKLGTYSIKISVGGYSRTYPLNVYQYGVTECGAARAFSECSTTEIQTLCQLGDVRNCWDIGDEKAIQLQSGAQITVQIVDFYHDVDEDNNPIPLTLCMKNCLNTKYQMNTTATSSGGWTSCRFKTVNLPIIENDFPLEWRQIMTPCVKMTAAGGNSYSLNKTVEKLFLGSEIEILGRITNTASGEGTVYSYFTNNQSRIKFVNGVASTYWTRSPAPNGGNTNRFSSISPIGDYNSSAATNEANTYQGIALFFCVG